MNIEPSIDMLLTMERENEHMRAQLDRAYGLLSNMPTHLDQDDAMIRLWIETRNKWLNEQIMEDDDMELHRENEQLRALVQDFVNFEISYRMYWQTTVARRDALIQRAKAQGIEKTRELSQLLDPQEATK